MWTRDDVFWFPETFFSSDVGGFHVPDCEGAREQSPPSFRKLLNDCVTLRSETLCSDTIGTSPGSHILRKNDQPESILSQERRLQKQHPTRLVQCYYIIHRLLLGLLSDQQPPKQSSYDAKKSASLHWC